MIFFLEIQETNAHCMKYVCQKTVLYRTMVGEKVILTLRLRAKIIAITFKKVTFLPRFLVKESLGVQFNRRECVLRNTDAFYPC